MGEKVWELGASRGQATDHRGPVSDVGPLALGWGVEMDDGLESEGLSAGSSLGYDVG